MRKRLSILLSLSALVVSLTMSPVNTNAQEADVDDPSPTPIPSSYELFYPVVAGKIPGDALYPLKTLREWFVDKLIFNKIKNSDYHLVLSKKRLVETEALIAKPDYTRANKTIGKVVQEINESIRSALKAKSQGKQTTDLVNTISSVVNTEIDFIEKSLLEKLPEGEKEAFISTSSSLKELLKKLE